MPQLTPSNLHESLWGPAANKGTVWARSLSPNARKDLAALTVRRAAFLGFSITSGETGGINLSIPSPPVVVDAEGHRGWVLTALEEPEQPIAIEWHESLPNDSRNVWVTSICGARLSDTHNYVPPQS